MAIPPEVQGHLQKTVEQWLRHSPAPSPQDVMDMADKLRNNQRPGDRQNISDYTRIVNQTINMFNSAEALRNAPNIRGTSLPTSGAIEQGQGRYFYYVIVSGRSIDGNEVYVTAIGIESDSLLTANELHDMAINQVTTEPQSADINAPGRRIDHYETFVLLAGQRART